MYCIYHTSITTTGRDLISRRTKLRLAVHVLDDSFSRRPAIRVPLEQVLTVEEGLRIVSDRLKVAFDRIECCSVGEDGGIILCLQDQLGDVVDDGDKIFVTLSRPSADAVTTEPPSRADLDGPMPTPVPAHDASVQQEVKLPAYPPAPLTEAGVVVSGVLTISYQTVSGAFNEQLKRAVQVPANGSLLDLKRAIAADLQVPFVPDVRRSDCISIQCEEGSSEEVDLRLALGPGRDITMKVLPYQSVASLIKRISSSASLPPTCAVSEGNKTEPSAARVDYLLLGGREFAVCDSIASYTPVQAILSAQAATISDALPLGAPVLVYGPGFLPVETMSNWSVNLVAAADSDMAIRLLETEFRIENYLLSGAASYNHTVADLKKCIADTYLRDLADQIPCTEITVAQSGSVLDDTILLRTSGKFS
jgi:hypothetical protein